MSSHLREFLAEQLPIIDKILAEQAVGIARRPFHAASMFVSECIVEIEGCSKDDFLEQSWFGDLLLWVHDWYGDRYGQAPLRSKDRVAPGLVLLFGTPFKLSVPLTLTEPGALPDTVWVIFPTNVQPGEAVLDWIVGPPNIERLTSGERLELEKDVCSVASSTRALDVNLMTADLDSAMARQLAASISAHISSGVDGIVSLEGSRLSLSVWELFMAVEKALKVVLHQRVGDAPSTHNLDDLLTQAYSHGLPSIDPLILAALPTASEAIRHRYGEVGAPTANSAVHVYRTALTVVEICACSLTRVVEFRDARFLIRKLPWARSGAS